MTTRSLHHDEPSTDVSLLRRAREGHDEGWRQLVEVYGPLVYRWMIGCGVQDADAADLMQDTLTIVSQSIDRFEVDRADASFRGWVWTIARNRLRDRQRAQRRHSGDQQLVRVLDAAAVRDFELQQWSQPPTDATSDQALVRSRMLSVLRDQFPPRAWEMFWSTEVEGRDPAEVALQYQVSKWAVYKAKARVLRRLRSELAGLE